MSVRAEGREATDDVASVVAALREEGSGIVDDLLRRNAARWEAASTRDRRRIEEVARRGLERFLSEPAERAAGLGGDDEPARAQALRELFGLEADA